MIYKGDIMKVFILNKLSKETEIKVFHYLRKILFQKPLELSKK
jgi:hypothetical protein